MGSQGNNRSPHNVSLADRQTKTPANHEGNHIMRKISERKRIIPPTLLVVLLPLLGPVSCTSPSNGPSSPNTQHTVIDWVNFIRFGGITYLAVPTRPGRSLTERDFGPVFATVTFKLEGNVQDPGYQSRDGDAAFLNAGTKISTVK